MLIAAIVQGKDDLHIMSKPTQFLFGMFWEAVIGISQKRLFLTSQVRAYLFTGYFNTVCAGATHHNVPTQPYGIAVVIVFYFKFTIITSIYRNPECQYSLTKPFWKPKFVQTVSIVQPISLHFSYTLYIFYSVIRNLFLKLHI